ncbi:coiled-coil domain-containing protein 74B-like [Littorina saxatilis]|uniref:Coiled-coil domain-containing protein 74A n=1 Tax=Littorina saxatilis TaxID=31220 RepID=A0AAN9AHW2_9CAEN
MLKQGLVQERIGDLTMNHLPPLNTLPQWSRVNNLDKARYPKPFVKDKLQPMEKQDDEDKDLDLTGMNPAQRIQYLERSLMFLRQQHSDVLGSLHEEVEGLKKENKDLQFKIVMSSKAAQQQKSSEHHEFGDKLTADDYVTRDFSASSSRSKRLAGSNSREDKLDELKVLFLEEEIKELKHALRETRNKNTYIQQLLEQSDEARKQQLAQLDSLKYQMTQGGAQISQMAEKIAEGQSPQETGGRPLSLPECQAIIRHMQQVNERQAHELEQLKSDLRDVLYSHKWTPDAYLLAKAYIAEDDKKDDSDSTSKSGLPKIALKNQTRKLPEVAYIRDTVSLPALRQTIGTKAVDRRKRTQILQKAKLRREVVPK